MQRCKFQPRIARSSVASAYIEIPEDITVMQANVTRVEPARLLVEAQLQVLRHRARLRAVIERHHEDGHEHHRRDRAHPVEVAGHDPVLGARGRHPHHFLRAQVGADEAERADPGRQRAPRLEEILRPADALAQHHADAEHEREVDDQKAVVDDAKLNEHRATERRAASRSAPERREFTTPRSRSG